MQDRTATTRYAILGLLQYEPMSGYDIRREAAGSLEHFWHESYGQIYPTLAKLAREGLVRAAAEPRRPSAGRPRRAFAITPAGRRALAAWRRRAPRERPPRSELLLKVFFGDAGSAREVAAHVTALAAKERARLVAYRALARRLAREAKGHPSLPFWRATLRYGELRSRASLRWCAETSRALAAAGRAK